VARDPKYDVLFEPVRLGPKTMRNRFYQVPHCNGVGSDRPGSQAAFRAMKAEGGWAVVCTEACFVDLEEDTAPCPISRLADEGDIRNHRHMTDGVHEWNSLAGVELVHLGAFASNLESRGVTFSSSVNTSPWTLTTYTREADEDDIRGLHRLFVEAAKRAEQAGFDIIYVYGSHSVLPMQFLSPYYNRRTDKYGGSFENRARFWIEMFHALKETIGDRCAVASRISVDQILGPAGIESRGEDILRLVELATREGLVDVWDINICDLSDYGEDAGPSRFNKSNHQAPFTTHITAHIKSIADVPVINVGRLTSPDDMLEVVSSGQADIIGAARPSIADPFLPNKIEAGRLVDICECIGCNVCISRHERGVPLVCTQNPTAMEAYRRGWHPERFKPASDSSAVLVVGAGPAGLECARVLGERGYDVHLREAEPEVGGHVREVMRYPGLAEWGRVISYRQARLDMLKNVEVHTGVGAMTASQILDYGAEKIVLCTGARWLGDGFSPVTQVAIPGVDAGLPQFLTPEQVMAGEPVGDRVVVLDADGYYTGASLAEYLADQGKTVSIVTQLPFVAPLTEWTLEVNNLHRMLHEKGIDQYPHHWIDRVEPGNRLKAALYNVHRDGYRRTTTPIAGELPRRAGTEEQVIECDSIVLVTARHPNDGLFTDLKARKESWATAGITGVYMAGDCYAPRQLSEAVFDGHRMAREIDSPHPQRPLPFIRERIVWDEAEPVAAGR